MVKTGRNKIMDDIFKVSSDEEWNYEQKSIIISSFKVLSLVYVIVTGCLYVIFVI